MKATVQARRQFVDRVRPPFSLEEIADAFSTVEQRKFVKARIQICENPHCPASAPP